MNIIHWADASAAERQAALSRPALNDDAKTQNAVRDIIHNVAKEGDKALLAYTQRFDGVTLTNINAPKSEIESAWCRLDDELKRAIERTAKRIATFHQAGAVHPYQVETAPGLHCERMIRPIQRVGLYVPAGSAPLPSTALMLCVPAQLAGCTDIMICSPPNQHGQVDDTVLAVAAYCGIRKVFAVGGAQAIAAMALGTESIFACDKVFGPGNAFVTEAKKQISIMPGGCAIDMPAGPSEALVIADESANPSWVAADLLAQAEHAPNAQVLLLTTSNDLAAAVMSQIKQQLPKLPRASIASTAMEASSCVVVDDLNQACAISNRYAPEHLLIQTKNARSLLPMIHAAGSVFVGHHTPESLGDYTSGTNHVLPTYGAARAYSGVSLASFTRQISVQEASMDGLSAVADDLLALSDAESLHAHGEAVRIRLRSVCS